MAEKCPEEEGGGGGGGCREVSYFLFLCESLNFSKLLFFIFFPTLRRFTLLNFWKKVRRCCRSGRLSLRNLLHLRFSCSVPVHFQKVCQIRTNKPFMKDCGKRCELYESECTRRLWWWAKCRGAKTRRCWWAKCWSVKTLFFHLGYFLLRFFVKVSTFLSWFFQIFSNSSLLPGSRTAPQSSWKWFFPRSSSSVDVVAE